MLTTATSDTLLAGLLRPDDDRAWTDYVARYRPLLVRYARRLGLPDADARLADEDWLQQEWTRQWQQAVLSQGLVEVRREIEPRTFAAFELFVTDAMGRASQSFSVPPARHGSTLPMQGVVFDFGGVCSALGSVDGREPRGRSVVAPRSWRRRSSPIAAAVTTD
ncbi:MAG TPA: hypothetical protein VFZ65_18110 [Planctomycetota bacterium]|nr:hypothetical protein [Planctomycetota bacterium]